MNGKEAQYYQARGFSVYYICNSVYNVTRNPLSYMRRIEEIIGDDKVEFYMTPFTKYTNLHDFIHAVASDILVEDVDHSDENFGYFLEFLKNFDVPYSDGILKDLDAFHEFVLESERYEEAVEELTEEVFHVLFNDVGFLQKFNEMCASYIGLSSFGEDYARADGTLKRTLIPKWARRAVFHRDKGECRSCKRNLTTIINQFDKECYDHIVPLARHGANDITNLQLLCVPCNLKKNAHEIPVSRLYSRVVVK